VFIFTTKLADRNQLFFSFFFFTLAATIEATPSVATRYGSQGSGLNN